MEDLEYATCNLVTADKKPMSTLGITPSMSFTLMDEVFWIKFVLVGELYNDRIILGRDFLKTYDVLVDVPRNQLIVRNPDQRYHIKDTDEIGNDAIRYVARVPKVIELGT